MGFLSKLSERLDLREVSKYKKVADKIVAMESSYAALSDEELTAKTGWLKERLANGETLDDILPDAFATVREASWRVLNMKHFPVQLIGGMILHEGNIAEMKTGEGKTLAATLPAYLNALSGQGVHIVTVNDYLAGRDSEWMGRIYTFLGLTVGLNIHGMNTAEKQAAYACDITYGTNNEFGFDYLRDNMVIQKTDMVQRDPVYAIVDEVDSILVDEARTPLIISGSGNESTDMYVRANAFARGLSQENDFVLDEKARTVTLTDEGVVRAERFYRVENLTDSENMELMHHINQAMKANYIFKADVDYVVQDRSEIIIVDDNTGRLMYGRRYSDGLHQAIEAKEGVSVKRESVTMATITLQNYFRMYSKLSGMTGTAKTEENEFKTIYGMDVVVVPTNLPMVRKDSNDVVYRSIKGKFEAVIRDIIERHEAGQPVLVGTISIEKSELLSRMLKKTGIPHQVLNAKYHEKEAEIIAQAGQYGAVTISTNMAGRGTDIVLGEGVRELGGLHIIGTERHESRRIDNQLRGRAGRQGDPGSSQFFLSIEDDLLRLFGGDRLGTLVDRFGMDDDMPLEAGLLTKRIESAQKTVEARNFGIRKNVLRYDDVMNKQREVIYTQRRSVLEGEDVSSLIHDYIERSALLLSDNYTTAESEFDEVFDTETLHMAMSTEFGISPTTIDGKMSREDIRKRVENLFLERYSQKEAEYSPPVMRQIERSVLFTVVDQKWMEHIDAMDQLKQGVGLQAYSHTDPVQAYTKEGFDMFDEMTDSIVLDTTKWIMRGVVKTVENEMPKQPNRQIFTNQEKPAASPAKRSGLISKNQPCPCGSGKKYKQCCGRGIA